MNESAKILLVAYIPLVSWLIFHQTNLIFNFGIFEPFSWWKPFGHEPNVNCLKGKVNSISNGYLETWLWHLNLIKEHLFIGKGVFYEKSISYFYSNDLLLFCILPSLHTLCCKKTCQETKWKFSFSCYPTSKIGGGLSQKALLEN